MISYDEAKTLLHDYGMPEKRIRHSELVARFAGDLARRIAAAHPEYGIDPHRVTIGGLLHDIGRCAPHGDHERVSVEICHRLGLHDIARIVIHGTIYEMEKLRGTDDPSLVPASVENEIVAYADARARDRIITLQERFDDLLHRKKKDSMKYTAVCMSRQRFEEMEKRLLDLAGQA